MKEKINIVFNGATGFIGKHMLEDFDKNKFSVRILTRKISVVQFPELSEIEIVNADLTDADSMINALNGIEVMINVAAEVRDKSQMKNVNVLGVKNLVEAVVKNKVRKVIHLSSVGVVSKSFSKTPFKVDEDAVCNPQNDYELSKLESEKTLLDAAAKHNFQLDIVRPTNVFGEYHPFNALLHLIQRISSGKKIAGTKQAKVNYVYVKDITALIFLLAESKKQYGIINAGYNCSLREFTGFIADELKTTLNYSVIPGFLSGIPGFRKLQSVSNAVVYDDSKLREFYNYPYGIEKGLHKTISYYKNKHLLK